MSGTAAGQRPSRPQPGGTFLHQDPDNRL